MQVHLSQAKSAIRRLWMPGEGYEPAAQRLAHDSTCRPGPTTRRPPCSLIFGFGESLDLSADELRRVHREDRVGFRPRVLGLRLRRGRRFCGHSEDEELRGFSFSCCLAGQMISWDVTESKPQQHAEASRYEAGKGVFHSW